MVRVFHRNPQENQAIATEGVMRHPAVRVGGLKEDTNGAEASLFWRVMRLPAVRED
jgi:hypothetical protein